MARDVATLHVDNYTEISNGVLGSETVARSLHWQQAMLKIRILPQEFMKVIVAEVRIRNFMEQPSLLQEDILVHLM